MAAVLNVTGGDMGHHMANGVRDLGATLDLAGGAYLLSRPLVVPLQNRA